MLASSFSEVGSSSLRVGRAAPTQTVTSRSLESNVIDPQTPVLEKDRRCVSCPSGPCQFVVSVW